MNNNPEISMAGVVTAEQCQHCGKDKVADYPECKLILEDLPTTDDIKNNNNWQLNLKVSFQITQRLRCDFMKFMIDRKFATPHPEHEGFYVIPETIQLHPQAMTDAEQELIQIARETVYTNRERPDGLFMAAFHKKREEYESRVRAFFDKQFQLLNSSAG